MRATFWKMRRPKAKSATRYRSIPSRSPTKVSATATRVFVTNTLVAVALTFVGDRLGIDLYLVALFAFGLRIFQNVALIRRHFL